MMLKNKHLKETDIVGNNEKLTARGVNNGIETKGEEEACT